MNTLCDPFSMIVVPHAMNTICDPFSMVVVPPPPVGPEIIYVADDIIVAIDDTALYVDTDGEGDDVSIMIKRKL